MHELAITESIVEAVAERAGAAKVTRVVIEIGKLSGVVPDSVRFCFDVCAESTALAGATLEIREINGFARCRDCGSEFTVDGFVAECECGGGSLELLRGQELKIREVELCDV
jgi:hydrogenase nickel incorporation protein HypA/HybF